MVFNRRVKCPTVICIGRAYRNSCVGVPSHKQQMKEQHRQSKIVVFKAALGASELGSLEFRRRPNRSSNFTQKMPSSRIRNLIGIAVNESDETSLGHKDVPFVH